MGKKMDAAIALGAMAGLLTAVAVGVKHPEVLDEMDKTARRRREERRLALTALLEKRGELERAEFRLRTLQSVPWASSRWELAQATWAVEDLKREVSRMEFRLNNFM